MKNARGSVDSPLTGVERIVAERRRQFDEEDYTAKTDAELPNGSLAAAAVCYATDEPIFVIEERVDGFSMVDPWPWGGDYDRRPREGNVVQFEWSLDERISLLVKAGALIAAEIDNLLYKAREGLEGLHLKDVRLGRRSSGRRPSGRRPSGRRPSGCRPLGQRPFAESESGPDEVP